VANSVREQIFAAIETELKEVAELNYVTRGKIDPLRIPNHPACFVVPGGDVVTEDTNNVRYDRELTVFLFLWIKTQSPFVHKAIEEVLPKVQMKMVEDYKLGGLTIDVQETNVHEPFPLTEDQTEAGVVLEYAVRYRVNRFNPYSQAA
jgi:hypothetical protein